MTGTDEHGQKIAEAAKKAGKKPKEFVDSFIPAYKDMWKLYDIDYTKFMRTTDEYHVHAVQKWIMQLIKQGDIYKVSIHGWYCTPCETFVTEKDNTRGAKEVTLSFMCYAQRINFRRILFFQTYQHIKITYLNFMKIIQILLHQKNVCMK